MRPSCDASGALRILFFGTYDVRTHPRVQVLIEGFRALGDDVVECNVPLGLDTSWRVRILRQPWLLPVLGTRLLLAWLQLWRRSRTLRDVDAVVVGYMGHFDVLLARRLFRGTPIALDHLISASDTAVDRGVSAKGRVGLLAKLDRAATSAADIVFVDTEAHVALLPAAAQRRAVVVTVGAPRAWFQAPIARPVPPLRVVFFGLYTPLQGAPTIGEALRQLHERGAGVHATMIGNGQDFAATQQAAAAADVTWRRWVPADELPEVVATHDVCLGIFGTGEKARRVVPNKVFQGAAAGCAIVTSDTPPQRDALHGTAVFVPPGDAAALADVLAALADDPDRVQATRVAAHQLAVRRFGPQSVVAPLRTRLMTAVKATGPDRVSGRPG